MGSTRTSGNVQVDDIQNKKKKKRKEIQKKEKKTNSNIINKCNNIQRTSHKHKHTHTQKRNTPQNTAISYTEKQKQNIHKRQTNR